MGTVSWLLDSDPSLRWQVMRDLLDAPGAEVDQERARVAAEGHGAQLLALQDERGYWNNEEYGEDHDRRSVFWSLALLRRLGADPTDPRVRAAVERVQESVSWKYMGRSSLLPRRGGALHQRRGTVPRHLLRGAGRGQRSDH